MDYSHCYTMLPCCFYVHMPMLKDYFGNWDLVNMVYTVYLVVRVLIMVLLLVVFDLFVHIS